MQYLLLLELYIVKAAALSGFVGASFAFAFLADILSVLTIQMTMVTPQAHNSGPFMRDVFSFSGTSSFPQNLFFSAIDNELVVEAFPRQKTQCVTQPH